jgi:hypothetical protein
MSKQDSIPVLIPVTKWHEHYEWPPIGGMRHLIFFSKTNGFASAFIRVRRRVLVDPVRFWSIVREQGGKS